MQPDPQLNLIANREQPSGVDTLATRPAWYRWMIIGGICMFVFFFSLWDSSSSLRTSEFHPDESRWINRAHYLRELKDPLGSFWADRYLIRAQPPMGSYFIGLGLLLQGRDLTTNGPWDFQFGFERNITWNVAHGNMPVEGDLLAVRRWNMVLGALTCVALVLIVGLLSNWFGAAIAGMFMAIHPLHIYLSTLAVSDAMFTTFVAFEVLTAIWLAMRPSWWRALLLAITIALGASTKLSPLFIGVGLAVFALALFVDPWLRRQRAVGRAWRLLSRRETGDERRLGLMLVLQPVIIFTLFVLVYPFLWSDPIGRTRTILDFRRYEMDNQAGFWPAAAIDSPWEALERTWQNLQDRTSSSERVIAEMGNLLGRDWSGHSFDLYLALPGLFVLVFLAWRNGLASPHMLGLVVLGGQSVLILAALGVDFNRYYEPLVFTTAVGVGVLSGWVGGLVWARVANLAASRKQPAAGSLPVSGSAQHAANL